MHIRSGLLTLVLAVLMANGTSVFAAPVWFEPTPYLSQDDLPPEIAALNPFVEDLEDNSIDSRLTIAPGDIIGPGFDSGIKDVTDSVDKDDGTIDGDGGQGHSFFYSLNDIAVEFGVPVKAAGLVFTDGPQNMRMTLEGFDANGDSVGFQQWDTTADEVFTGTTGEDRFVGLMYDKGVSKLLIKQEGEGLGIEIDHITFAVPEPGTTGMLLLAGAILAGLRRRRTAR